MAVSLMHNQESSHTAVSEARERVLAVAERLFSERGYAAVTLRDIAEALGIRQASLYHHVPGGKAPLFTEVMERNFRRHKIGLENAITEAGEDVRSQLVGVAKWLMAQPVMDLTRMMASDMAEISSEISTEEADRLSAVCFACLIMPVAQIFVSLDQRDELRVDAPFMLGATFVTIVEGLHGLPDHLMDEPKSKLIEYMVEVVMHGAIGKPDPQMQGQRKARAARDDQSIQELIARTVNERHS